MSQLQSRLSRSRLINPGYASAAKQWLEIVHANQQRLNLYVARAGPGGETFVLCLLGMPTGTGLPPRGTVRPSQWVQPDLHGFQFVN